MHSESEVLTVTTAVHGSEQATVSVCGELDADTSTLLRHQLAVLVLQNRRHLVLDLAGVPFMDSSGLNSVLRARAEILRHEGSLVLAAPTPAVRRLLEITGISLTVPLYDTTDHALAAGPAR